MTRLIPRAVWRRFSHIHRRFFPAMCAFGTLVLIGCSREAMEKLKAAPAAESRVVETPDLISPQQSVGGPVDLFVHRPAQGESQTMVVPPGGGNFALSHGIATGDSPGPTLGEIAPTIISASQPSSLPTDSQTARWVDLTLPVVLPQTGPAGTVMSFGAEYRLLPEAPRDQTFAWVIRSQTGKVFRLDGLRLEQQGNLMTIVAEWRPEDGPFSSWIEDSLGRPVSRKLDF